MSDTVTLICEQPTRAYPGGRRGTNAGWQAHMGAGEKACPECAEGSRGRQRVDYAKNKDAIKDRARRYRHQMTRAEYDELLKKQGGGCAVCGTTEPGGSQGFYFHVDHDHEHCPGRASCPDCRRGLLCAGCNVGLGSFGDDPERLIAAAAYLMEWRNARS